MNQYKNWSTEELRAQDYQANRKTAAAGPATGGFGATNAFGAPANTGGFGQPASTSTGFGAFGQNNNNNANKPFGSGGFGAFGANNTNTGTTTNAFGQPAASTNAFGQPANATTSTGFGAFGQPAQNTGGFGAFGNTNNNNNQNNQNKGFGAFGMVPLSGFLRCLYIYRFDDWDIDWGIRCLWPTPNAAAKHTKRIWPDYCKPIRSLR